MKVLFTVRFHRSFADAPENIKRAFERQLSHLLRDFRHPSIQAKKYDVTRWQGRVTRGWRFYFRIEGDTYIVLDIMAHPK
jgi:hypothetical protein